METEEEKSNSNDTENKDSYSDIQNISPEAFGLLKRKRDPGEEQISKPKIPPRRSGLETQIPSRKPHKEKDDFSLIDHLSSINIAIAEDKRKLEEEELRKEEEESSEYSKGKIMMFISTILIILSLIITLGIFIVNKSDPLTIPEEEKIESIISFETFSKLDTTSSTPNSFQREILTEMSGPAGAENSLEYKVITVGTDPVPIQASDFVDLAGLTMPDILKRALLGDFMLGLYFADGVNPFLILKFSDFRNAYTGMLSWEENMRDDFQNLFNLDSREIPEQATSTLIETDKFEDTVISNKYTRQLRKKDNGTILIYGIINSETIIITVNEMTFKEILDRINKKALINI